jgi:toxin ParE1/3/4
MKLDVLIRPEAERDIEDAFKWYENKRTGLGSDFLLCVEEGLAKIWRSPEVYSTVHKNARRFLIRRFPYGIFYLLDRGLVVVLAVLHARRDPQTWLSRSWFLQDGRFRFFVFVYARNDAVHMLLHPQIIHFDGERFLGPYQAI